MSDRGAQIELHLPSAVRIEFGRSLGRLPGRHGDTYIDIETYDAESYREDMKKIRELKISIGGTIIRP